MQCGRWKKVKNYLADVTKKREKSMKKEKAVVLSSRLREWDKMNAEYYVGDYNIMQRREGSWSFCDTIGFGHWSVTERGWGGVEKVWCQLWTAPYRHIYIIDKLETRWSKPSAIFKVKQIGLKERWYVLKPGIGWKWTWVPQSSTMITYSASDSQRRRLFEII